MSVKNYDLVKFVDGSFELEVNVSPSEETVWLTQEQMADLFQKAKSTINWHIRNAYNDGELSEGSMKKFENIDFSKKPTNYYNLDVVIAVGYRVKSLRGVVFRKWATSVLKQYLLKGFAIDSSRVLVSPENYLDLVNVINRIDRTQINLVERVERLEDKYPDLGSKIFFKGQLYDAMSCIEQILEGANNEIILIDNYVDRKTLDILSAKKSGVRVTIYTSEKGNGLTEKQVSDFDFQYPPIDVAITDEFHDRFIILDRVKMFHTGASIKDAGKKAFEISENTDRKQLEQILLRL